MKFIKNLFIFMAEYELFLDEIIFWNKKLEFFVNCSDFFVWASCDAEIITEKNFHIFKKSIEETDRFNGPLLFCARIRGMRPQGAYYQYLDKKFWHLFDECGPEREINLGNPEEKPVL